MDKKQAKEIAQEIISEKLNDVVEFWFESYPDYSTDEAQLIHQQIKIITDKFYAQLGYTVKGKWKVFQKLHGGKRKDLTGVLEDMDTVKAVMKHIKKDYPGVKIGYRKV